MNTKWRKRLIYWLPAILLYALITWLSHQPKLPAPGTPLADFLWFKGAHMLVYATLTAFVWFAWKRGEWFQSSYRLYRVTFIVLFVAACLDEWHQTFIVGRTGRLSDVLIDMLATSGALLVISRYNRPRR